MNEFFDIPETLKQTTVVHCRKKKFDVYIGRKCKEFPQSIWANKYREGKDGTRDEVIAKYKKDITPEMELVIKYKLRGKILGCWCYPKNCHGNVLASIANAR